MNKDVISALYVCKMNVYPTPVMLWYVQNSNFVGWSLTQRGRLMDDACPHVQRSHADLMSDVHQESVYLTHVQLKAVQMAKSV